VPALTEGAELTCPPLALVEGVGAEAPEWDKLGIKLLSLLVIAPTGDTSAAAGIAAIPRRSTQPTTERTLLFIETPPW
jgi:hypothetical protein